MINKNKQRKNIHYFCQYTRPNDLIVMKICLTWEYVVGFYSEKGLRRVRLSKIIENRNILSLLSWCCFPIFVKRAEEEEMGCFLCSVKSKKKQFGKFSAHQISSSVGAVKSLCLLSLSFHGKNSLRHCKWSFFLWLVCHVPFPFVELGILNFNLFTYFHINNMFS